MIKENFENGNKSICQFLGLITIFGQKLISWSVIYLFLLDPKIGLYPYKNIEDSFFSHIISSNAIFFKVFCSFIAFIVGTISIIFCFFLLRKIPKMGKIVKSIFFLFLIVSTFETVFLWSRFVQFKYVASLVENCEFKDQVQVGCYISPEKF